MYIPRLINSREVDVLIIDEFGSDMVVYCMPENATFSILPTRNIIPLILKISFLFSIFKRLFKMQGIKKTVLFSIIDTLKPKVMITHIDNSQIMSYLHSEFPDKLTISIQSGWRCESKVSGFPKALGQFFYGFGEYEKKLLIIKKTNFNEYIAAGSIKYGVYKKYYCTEKKIVDNDICYISCFVDREKTNIEGLEAQKLDEKLFLYLVNFCLENNLTVAVAARGISGSDLYESERKYYKDLDVHDVAKIIPRNGVFGSYDLSYHSEIIVNTMSTLGFEMFGGGKKVLFGASKNDFELARLWKAVKNFEKLPSYVLLDDLTLDGVAVKLRALIDMDNKKYLTDTETASVYYMNHRNGLYLDDLVKKKINEYLVKH